MHYVKCNQYSKHKKILLLKHVARKIEKETDCLPNICGLSVLFPAIKNQLL